MKILMMMHMLLQSAICMKRGDADGCKTQSLLGGIRQSDNGSQALNVSLLGLGKTSKLHATASDLVRGIQPVLNLHCLRDA